VKLCAVYPPEDNSGDGSVVVRVSFDRVHFLFGSDIDGKDEKILLSGKINLSSAIVKAPRHGSAGSSSSEFIGAVKPKLAIFSVGLRNAFGLPREEVLSRYAAAGAEILRTDRDGAITIETDGKSVRYQTYRSGKRGEMNFRH
jgi:competence protein ComEC